MALDELIVCVRKDHLSQQAFMEYLLCTQETETSPGPGRYSREEKGDGRHTCEAPAWVRGSHQSLNSNLHTTGSSWRRS